MTDNRNVASIRFYGGVDEIGGNKFLLNMGDSSIFLDFGLSFGREGEFFEKFLQPRSAVKLHDLLRLGILPQLDGVYRGDALAPDGLMDLTNNPSLPLWRTGLQSYEEALGKGDWTPDAVFISHAHLDHCGYVPFLGNVPLLCSGKSRTIMETIAELGSLSGFDGELVEMKRRCVGSLGKTGYFPGEPKVVREEAVEREIVSLNDGRSESVGEVDVTGFEVGHSIPGSMACLIGSKDKQLVYTGDLRFHGRWGRDLGDELEGLRPDAMLCEGTRIDDDRRDDEERVERDLSEEISGADGLVMVGFGWKDLERYETVVEAARSSGRVPVLDPRLAYLRARLDGSVYDDGAKVFVERSSSMLYSGGDYVRSKHKASDIPISEWDRPAGAEERVHLEKGVGAAEIGRAPGEYVLHLDYYRFKNLVDLDPPSGSIFVRAQTEPFNPEMELSEERLRSWLRRFGINEDQDYRPIQIHASGHASGPEIQEMIDKIGPKKLIPVHTEHPHMFKNPSGEVELPSVGQAIGF